MTMFKYFAVLSFLASAIAVTPVTQCSSGLPMPDQVDFNGCTQEVCDVEKGSKLTMNVTFFATKTLETVHMEAFAEGSGAETPFPLPETDVCQLFTNTQCPVTEGEMATFHASMYLLDTVPEVPVGLSFALQESPDTEIINCFHVRTQIPDN